MLIYQYNISTNGPHGDTNTNIQYILVCIYFYQGSLLPGYVFTTVYSILVCIYFYQGSLLPGYVFTQLEDTLKMCINSTLDSVY
jgi:hypothetical protein